MCTVQYIQVYRIYERLLFKLLLKIASHLACKSTFELSDILGYGKKLKLINGLKCIV